MSVWLPFNFISSKPSNSDLSTFLFLMFAGVADGMRNVILEVNSTGLEYKIRESVAIYKKFQKAMNLPILFFCVEQ